MQRITVVAGLTGIATMIALIVVRGFFWQHALIVGAAVTALVFAGRNAVKRIRRSSGR